MMQKCSSPNLVKCYEVYENDDLKIIPMEFCKDGTLQHYVNSRSNIPEREAISIIRQVINGVAVQEILIRNYIQKVSYTET